MGYKPLNKRNPWVYTGIKKWINKWKECQLINVEGITELENEHLVTTTVIIYAGKIAGESLMRKRIFTQSPQNT